jgi:hypothetical protein
VATDEGPSRLPDGLPRVRMTDFELSRSTSFHEGLLMAPTTGIRACSPAIASPNRTSPWETKAFAAQVLCHVKALETALHPH